MFPVFGVLVVVYWLRDLIIIRRDLFIIRRDLFIIRLRARARQPVLDRSLALRQLEQFTIPEFDPLRSEREGELPRRSFELLWNVFLGTCAESPRRASCV